MSESILGLLEKYLNIDIIHSAPIGFIVLRRSSTGCKSLASIPWSSCSSTHSEYHSWNFLLKKSFAALLTVASNGWRRSVQLGGTRTKRMLFRDSKSTHAWVICPLNSSNIATATWSSVFLSSFFLFLTNGTMIFDNHGCFVAPMIFWMSYMPILWELHFWVTLGTFTLVYKLDW